MEDVVDNMKQGMNIIQELRTILKAKGVDDTQYTDFMLEGYIMEAKARINRPWTSNKVYNDYHHEFRGNRVITQYYPIIQVCKVLLDDEEVEVCHSTVDGIIYFDKQLFGRLEVQYVVGLQDEDYLECILPLSVNSVLDDGKHNVTSVTEGDLTVNYSSNYSATQNDLLVQSIRDKYQARTWLI